MVVKINHGSESSQIFHFSSSEVKQRSDRSQRFHFLMSRKLFFSGLYYNSNSERNMIS